MFPYIPLFTIPLTFDNNLTNRLIWVKFRIPTSDVLFMHGLCTLYVPRFMASKRFRRHFSLCLLMLHSLRQHRDIYNPQATSHPTAASGRVQIGRFLRYSRRHHQVINAVTPSAQILEHELIGSEAVSALSLRKQRLTMPSDRAKSTR